jgi:hypothetical protein
MENDPKFELNPLPLESEFKIQSVRHRLHQLDRNDLELFLAETLDLLVHLTHQTKQMRDYIEMLEGKS